MQSYDVNYISYIIQNDIINYKMDIKYHTVWNWQSAKSTHFSVSLIILAHKLDISKTWKIFNETLTEFSEIARNL